MKIERISLNKLKVTVSAEDLFMHGISLESFVADSPRVQDFFWNLIQKAEDETNFSIEDGRVMIEAMPLKNDGIVIFLTKPDEQVPPDSPKIRRVRYRVKRHDKKQKKNALFLYRFETFEDLCAFAKEWRYMGERSSLYALEDTYFLALSFDGVSYDKAYMEAQILEFAYPERKLTESYLEEHAKKICDKDAIASLLRYF